MKIEFSFSQGRGVVFSFLLSFFFIVGFLPGVFSVNKAFAAAETVVTPVGCNGFSIQPNFHPSIITGDSATAWFRVYRFDGSSNWDLGYIQGVWNSYSDLNLQDGPYGYALQYYGSGPVPGYAETAEYWTWDNFADCGGTATITVTQTPVGGGSWSINPGSFSGTPITVPTSSVYASTFSLDCGAVNPPSGYLCGSVNPTSVSAYNNGSYNFAITYVVDPAPTRPDLTAGVPTPSTATAGASTTLSSRITNSGDASTGASFYNQFTVATASGGGGAQTPLTATSMLALSANGGNANTNISYIFPSAGTYSVKACADSTNVITNEVSEGNNCSPWTTVTVAPPPTPPIPPNNVSATPGVCNSGQITITWGAVANATSYKLLRGTSVSGPFSVINSNATSPFTNSGLTLDQAYYYTVHAVNAYGESGDSNIAGSMAPSCALPPMSGTLTPASSSCTIAVGASSCTSPLLTWTTTNPQGTSAITNNGTATPSSPSGNNSSSTFTVPYLPAFSGVTTFYLYNNAQQLAVATVTTNCIAGSTWVGGVCSATTPVWSVTLKGRISGTIDPFTNPIVINPGQQVNIVFQATGTFPTDMYCYANRTDGVPMLSGTATGGAGWFTIINAGGPINSSLNFNGACRDANNSSNSVAYTPLQINVISPPTVTSPTHSSITTTGATLGANVTSAGYPASISARGTCWGTTTNPTTNCTPASGTTTGVFTHARTGMPSNTLIYYRGYATNSTGTGYSASSSFVTGSTVPTLDITGRKAGDPSYVQGPITIASGSNVDITYTGTNLVPNSCIGTGWWGSGPYPSNGTNNYLNMGGVTFNTFFELTCDATAGGTITDRFTVNIGPTGNLTASDCTIIAGASSCNSNLTWSTTYPVGTSGVTSPVNNSGASSPNFSVANGNSGSITAPVFGGSPNGTRDFYLYNNAVLLDTQTATASCESGSTWNGSICEANPVINPTATIDASPTTIVPPATSTLTWSSTDATSCTASGGWSGAKATSGTEVVSPIVTTTYIITCDDGSTASLPDQVTVTVGAGEKKPIFIED